MLIALQQWPSGRKGARHANYHYDHYQHHDDVPWFHVPWNNGWFCCAFPNVDVGSFAALTGARERTCHFLCQKRGDEMIRFEHISKRFTDGARTVEAVKDVSLEIEKGSIAGIIGFSGAGKSTLARCINLLERPTEGKVIVGGTELLSLIHI